jgi:predicted phage terminase large subunit-like protein
MAERELRARREREAAEPDLGFGAWMARARPEVRWDYAHFLAMQERLDRMTRGELRRLLVTIPIRHGKSEHNTVGFSTYELEREPTTRVLLGSYSQRQANKFSRQIRRFAKKRGVSISSERDAAEEWETEAGGGVRAIGSGSGTASINADLIVIDDPVGSREEAESPAHRERVWDWITSDVLARAEPHTRVIITASRWHQDDVPGRISDRLSGTWEVLDLPGRAEEDDPLGRAPGAPLWPELRGEEWLTEKEGELGSYGFASLIQGRPRPREGGMFRWEWWRLLDDVPETGQVVRYWDLAGTGVRSRGHDPDYTAGAALCRMADGRTAIVDVERFRKSVAERDAELLRLAREDLERWRGRVRWWIETEAGISGRERTENLVRALQGVGLAVYTEHPTGAKVLRAEPLASAAEAGNVLLCPGAWRDAFRSEAADFPTGKHDDQIDAAAGAFAKLSDERRLLSTKRFKV